MLRTASFLLGVALVISACTSTDPGPRRESDERPYIALYFVRDAYLVPQFRRLPPGEPVREIFDLLAAGPNGELLRTAIPSGSTVLQEAEPQEGELILDLDDRFWSGSEDEIRTRAAQVVFTMAGLEEGRAITLLQGSAPGRITEENGESIQQPLSAEEFPAPRPLIQVVQPAAGATVPSKVPVAVEVPRGVRAWGIISIDEVLGRKMRLRNGAGVLGTEVQGTKNAKVVFVVLRGSDRVAVSVPVTISG